MFANSGDRTPPWGVPARFLRGSCASARSPVCISQNNIYAADNADHIGHEVRARQERHNLQIGKRRCAEMTAVRHSVDLNKVGIRESGDSSQGNRQVCATAQSA